MIFILVARKLAKFEHQFEAYFVVIFIPEMFVFCVSLYIQSDTPIEL